MRPRFSASHGFAVTSLAAVVTVLALFAGVRPGLAQQEGQPVYARDYLQLIDQAKQQLIFDEVRRERAEARREYNGAVKKGAHKARRARGAKVGNVVDEDVAAGRIASGAKSTESRFGVQSTLVAPTNVKVNDKTGDGATAGQAEERTAIVGSLGLGAFNNGQGFNTGGDVQGTSYTLNGGATWIKTPVQGTALAGSPPHFAGSPARTWTSDPVISVNEKTGDFWYEGLIAPATGFNGVGAVRATFPGGVFTWDTPRQIVSYSNSVAAADKEWFAADSSNGNLYASWTRFDASDHIMFSRSTNNGVTWSPETQLSDFSEDGWVQGSRVEVGPNGEVYVIWSTLGGYIGTPQDYMMIRRSTDGGVTWGPETILPSQYSNFGTGAPGFNRQRGITFPSLAVDRSTGPKRGRVYVAFEDCVNWYDDPLGGLGSLNETENNGFFGNATLFTPGQRLRGTISSTADLDYWKFNATQGTTYIFWCDSLNSSLLYSMRVFCTDTTGGGTRLAGSGDLSNPGRQGFIVWTAPTSATYYLRFAPGNTGGYRVETGVDAASPPPERARDSRDDFVTYSDNGGATWSSPTRTNDDPPYYDNYLPEVQVGCDGFPYVMWYDFRDAVPKCGGVANIYGTRSTDYGNTWAASQVVTTAQTNFTTALSNIAPNMGDYNGMYGGKTLSMAWGDGRLGDVDVFNGNIINGPSVTCPNDTTVLAGTTYCAWHNLINSNVMYGDNYSYTVTVDRPWPGTPLSGSMAVAASSAGGISPCFNIPSDDPNGDAHVCITVSCSGACVATCCYTLHVVNLATATLASLVDASAGTDGVHLMWEVSGLSNVNVYRSESGSTWTKLATVAPDGSHRVAYTDGSVIAGHTYGYRLGFPETGGEQFAGETYVDVPLNVEFALRGARPNPTSGPLSVAFSLKDDSPATLELVDLVGRRVFTRQVGTLGAGFHIVPLDRANLPLGIYAVRLTQHGRTLTSKVTVIR